MRKILFSSILAFIFSGNIIAGGPWPQPKGKGYFKLSEWWIVFDQHYTDQGLLDPNVTNGVFNTFFYGEYGLSDRFTIIANAPLFSRSFNNNLRSATTNEVLAPGDAINSIGDIDLGFKYGISKVGAKIPVALSLSFGLPTGNSSGGIQNNLQTGDGEFNQIIQLDAGHGFKLGKKSSYVSGYLGFNHRTKGFSEEFRLGLEFGLGFLKEKLWINTKFNLVESLKNGDTAAEVNSTSIFANNSEFASIAIEANYYITKKIGISAGMAGAFRGEIIAAAPSYNVGIFYDLK